MKYLSLLFAFTALGLFGVNGWNKVTRENLVINASFENQLQHWTVRKAGSWSDSMGVGNSGALIMNSDVPPEDKYIHENTVEQCVKLDNGEKYQLSAKFKADKVLSGEYAEKAKFGNRIYIVWYESLDCRRGGQSGGWIEPRNIAGWQHLSVDNQTPAFGAKAALIKVTQNGRFSRGYPAYWDSIQFFATAHADPASQDPTPPNSEYTVALYENYLKNGAFNSDLSAWRSYRSTWSPIGNRLAGSARVSYESKKDSYGTGALSQCVNIGDNTKFNLGAMVKKDPESTQDGGGRIRVSWHNKENCAGRSKTDVKSDSFRDIEGWHELKVEGLHAPEHTQSVVIELIQFVAGPGIYTVYWDDVYFKAVE